MKFRKKSIIIDAFRWDGAISTINMLLNLGLETTQYSASRGIIYDLRIKTLEGEHIVSNGDWIIRGVKGEFYSCKPDIFKLTYEEVEEPF